MFSCDSASVATAGTARTPLPPFFGLKFGSVMGKRTVEHQRWESPVASSLCQRSLLEYDVSTGAGILFQTVGTQIVIRSFHST